MAEAKSKTVQFADFSGGINRTASRTRMKDTQLYWCEQAQPIGPGQLQILPPKAASIVTIGAGIATLWGINIKIGGVQTARLISINNDGSATQITPATGATVSLGAAGTFTTAARLAMWRDSELLIVDPTKGYFTWSGAALTVIDATKTGTAIAVFEGRVWLVTATRTLSFSAPNSNTDFTAASGGGSTTLTDAIFAGSITGLLSALELLWIVGPNAINAISNVQTAGTPLLTTFSNTNIVANAGTTLKSSIASFFRTFLFLTPYGVYAVVGATPQKLSDDLDGLFPLLSLGADQPAAVFTLNSVFVWAVLVTYVDPVPPSRPILLCFARNAWFVGNQGTGLTWITSLVDPATGTPQLWGTDGTTVFQCFAGTGTSTFTIQTKLWDFGVFTQRKQLLRVAEELSSPGNVIAASTTLENESGNAAAGVTIFSQNTMSWINNSSVAITFVGAGAITWITSGLQIARGAVDFSGNYLGLKITGTSLPFTLNAIAMEVAPLGEWTFPVGA